MLVYVCTCACRYMCVRSHALRPEINFRLLLTFSIFLFYFIYETRSYYISLAGLELTLYNRLSSNSQKSTCLFLFRVRIKDIITPSLSTLFLQTGSLSEPRAQGLAKLAGHCRDMLVSTTAALGYRYMPPL